MSEQDETLDVQAAVELLNAALALQYRSALQYTLTSGSLFGFELVAIEPTGREGRSEALEHTLEHLIMRKQNQVDFLLRARRQS